MKEKKNIDRLFQEKFKDFEAQPSPHVWESIAAREKKKRRAVIPLWFKLGGVAAILALVLFGGKYFLVNTTNNAPVVFEENPEQETVKDSSTETPVKVASEEEESESNDGIDNTQNNQITTGDSESTNYRKSQKQSTKKPRAQFGLKASSDAVADNSNGTNPTQNNTESQSSNTDSSSQTIMQNPDSSSGSATDKAVAATNTDNSTTPDKAADPDELLRLANTEEQVAETELKENENSKSSRWGIAPMVAPVYYGDFGGSGIDPQFANNAKRGDVNVSYGLQVSYAVNDKVKLRAGVNRVDLGYRTEEVAFSPSIQPSSLKSIDYNQNVSQVQVSAFRNTAGSIPYSLASEEFAASASMAASSTLHQQLGYIEVPLEAEFALIDKKIGFQVIGGFSTLFLNDDSIILEDGSQFSTELGSSNSLNTTSFSTNIGLGFDYQITPAIEFNLEPMFKYQLNAYTKGVSDFKPYYMGLYTGINLRF